ncbi:MAG: 4'-phosphopantetheinyl transferase superfamily protein [Candidatus Latescibacterota bacterium]
MFGEMRSGMKTGTCIRILWTDLAGSPREFQRQKSGFFPENEAQRIGRFVRETDRRLRFAAACLLTELVGELPGAGAGVSIERNHYGRPQLNGIEHADISVSHSGEIVVCALSTQGSIGIDIEQERPVEIGDFVRVFPESLWSWMHHGNPSDGDDREPENRRFFHAWTRLESVAKAHGKGLSSPLGDFVFEDKHARLGTESWRLHTIPVYEGYVCSLAVNGKIVQQEIRRAVCCI